MDFKIGAVSTSGGIEATVAKLPPARSAAPGAPSVKAPNPAPEVARQASLAEVRQAVDQANRALVNKASNELRFTIEEGTGISVIKLIDRQTGDAIMQFPSQVMLEIAKTIDQLTGAIIKRKA